MSTRAFVPRDEVTASGPPAGPLRLPDPNGRLAVFDLDRTLLPGSSLSLLGRAPHRAGMLGSRRMAGYLAREAIFVRQGQGAPAARPGARWLLDRHLAAGAARGDEGLEQRHRLPEPLLPPPATG